MTSVTVRVCLMPAEVATTMNLLLLGCVEKAPPDGELPAPPPQPNPASRPVAARPSKTSHNACRLRFLVAVALTHNPASTNQLDGKDFGKPLFAATAELLVTVSVACMGLDPAGNDEGEKLQLNPCANPEQDSDNGLVSPSACGITRTVALAGCPVCSTTLSSVFRLKSP